MAWFGADCTTSPLVSSPALTPQNAPPAPPSAPWPAVSAHQAHATGVGPAPRGRWSPSSPPVDPPCQGGCVILGYL
eukprot:gene4268-biopygen4036